jgi:hypothetical protein
MVTIWAKGRQKLIEKEDNGWDGGGCRICYSSACSLIVSGCLLGSFFDPEDGNIGERSLNYTASHPRRSLQVRMCSAVFPFLVIARFNMAEMSKAIAWAFRDSACFHSKFRLRYVMTREVTAPHRKINLFISFSIFAFSLILDRLES